MMKVFPPWALKAGIILVLIILVGAGGLLAYQAHHNAIQNALFDGPFEVCERESPSFYPKVNYNTAEYTAGENGHGSSEMWGASKFSTESDAGEIAWVDGEARDEVEEAMRKHADRVKENLDLTRLRYASVYKDRRPSQSLQIVFPNDGSIFPPNLCAPYVSWEDPTNTLWQVCVQFNEESEPLTFITSKKRWRFPKSLWRQICENAGADKPCLFVKGIELGESGQKSGSIQASETVHFTISKDPADNYIVYRLVAPPFSSYKTPDIYSRDIREDKPKSFLSARRQYCLNCHNFSSKQGQTGKLALQVRSLVKVENNLPTYLAIYDIDKQKGFKVRLPFEIQMTTFMSWTRDGSKLAYSANQKVAALKPIVFETQLAGMATSDIAIYDLDNNDTYLVPGASDPNLLEIYPEWSPDGSQLIFARSPVGDHPAHILYDLCILDLNGENEPVARPIEGASNNSRSNFYPHYSPDGKWLSFCQSDGGDLIRSSSDIYLKAADLTGPARRLEFNVDSAADSWHSWSSNSRWLVFASKREGGVYAYLYLSHIDDEGHASPAIPLPIEERPLASFNIPEFAAHLPTIREKELFNAIRVEPEPREVHKREFSKGGRHVQEEKS